MRVTSKWRLTVQALTLQCLVNTSSNFNNQQSSVGTTRVEICKGKIISSPLGEPAKLVTLSKWERGGQEKHKIYNISLLMSFIVVEGY